MSSTSTGAAAACTPCWSFFSLSRPLVLLLVVGPGVLVRDGPSVLGGARMRFACCGGVCACACVPVHACFIPAGSSALLAPLASSPCFGVIPPPFRPFPDLMADAPAVRRRRVRGEDAVLSSGDRVELGKLWSFPNLWKARRTGMFRVICFRSSTATCTVKTIRLRTTTQALDKLRTLKARAVKDTTHLVCHPNELRDIGLSVFPNRAAGRDSLSSNVIRHLPYVAFLFLAQHFTQIANDAEEFPSSRPASWLCVFVSVWEEGES